MSARIEYQAGAATCWVVNAPGIFEYSCGPLQHGRIDKSTITAVGIQDDRQLTRQVRGAAAAQRLMGVQGGLGGLLIAYRVPGKSKPRLATVTFDFGLPECQAFVEALIAEVGDRYVGTATRGALMKKMGVSRLTENLLIVGLFVVIGLVAYLMTKR